MAQQKTIICDIDGVLCNNKRVPYFQKKPNFSTIFHLRKFYYGGYKIILFTSRLSKYRESTKRWLGKFKVPYHQLIMNKPKGDYYIDDKAIKDIRKIKFVGRYEMRARIYAL